MRALLLANKVRGREDARMDNLRTEEQEEARQAELHMPLTKSEKVQTWVLTGFLLLIVWAFIVAAALFLFGISDAIG